jgi:hypothetical protein
MIKKMDTVFIHIQMAGATRVNGKMENNMEKVFLLVLRAYLEKVNGKKANVYTGKMK